jgi:hypothetical protein
MFSRRVFMSAIAGVCVPRGKPLVLEAIAAERMPQRWLLHDVEPSAFFELRDYGVAEPRLARVLSRIGIQHVLHENGKWLFPFESLASREKAWREVSVDPEWIEMRQTLVLKEISVFRIAAPRSPS